MLSVGENKLVRSLIRDAVGGLFEARIVGHFKERVHDRLEGENTNFHKEKLEIKQKVYEGITFLSKVSFPGQDNIGVLMLKGPNKYVYHNDVGGKIEHSEGNYVWVVVRANDLETIVFGDANYVPRNTQIRLTIDKLRDYIINYKDSDYNLTDKDLRKLQVGVSTNVERPKENIVIINGVKWIVDEVNEKIYKKNNPEVTYDVYEFADKLDEKTQDEILSYLDVVLKEEVEVDIRENAGSVFDGNNFYSWLDYDAIPFLYYGDKLYMGNLDLKTHLSIQKLIKEKDPEFSKKSTSTPGGNRRNIFPYEGRIWTESKIIAFWDLPDSNNALDDVIADLNNASKGNFRITDKWMINNKDDVLESISDYKKGFSVGDNIDIDSGEERDFHMASPLDKTGSGVKPGFGSEHSGYGEKRAMDWALGVAEGKSFISESYKKRMRKLSGVICENADDVWEGRTNLSWEDHEAVPFYYYSNKIYIGNHEELKTHYQLFSAMAVEIEKENPKLGEKLSNMSLKEKRDLRRYSGRIWTKSRVISFWDYPESGDIFKKVINDLNAVSKGDFRIDDTWRIYTKDDNLENISDYIGGEMSSQDKEKMEKGIAAHMASPLDKTGSVVSPGFGSKNPNYAEKRAMDWALGVAEGKSFISESYRARLMELGGVVGESAENVWDGKTFLRWPDYDAIPFYYYNNKMYIGDSGNLNTHRKVFDDMTIKIGKTNPKLGEKLLDMDWQDKSALRKYMGRMWTEAKVMSFWEYPENGDVLKKIINDLNAASNGRFFIDDEWRIEVDGDKLENISDYIGKEMSAQEKDAMEKAPETHMVSPMDKTDYEVRPGFGSKNPSYAEKRAMDWALGVAEGKSFVSESYRARLMELGKVNEVFLSGVNDGGDPDFIRVDGVKYDYKSAYAYPFYYYKDEFYLGGPGTMHLDISDEIYKDLLASRNSSTEDAPNKVGDIDYAAKLNGRLWTNIKVIAFWDFPENEYYFKRLVNDLNNFANGLFTIDNTWRVLDKGNHLVPISEYVGSELSPGEKADMEKRREMHVASPMDKGSEVAKKGFGSEHSGYGEKRAMDWALGRAQ